MARRTPKAKMVKTTILLFVEDIVECKRRAQIKAQETGTGSWQVEARSVLHQALRKGKAVLA